jgi:hypothetical protein
LRHWTATTGNRHFDANDLKKMNVGIEIIAAFEDLEALPECIKQ